MEKTNFLLSIFLVLIAQMPLLLKLYLDYRSKKDVFRQGIHKRHMDAYEEIAAAMNELQSIQHGMVTLFYENVKNEDKFLQSIRKSEAKAWVKWNSLIKKKEFLLPAELVENISKYSTFSAKTMSIGMDISEIKTVEQIKSHWQNQVELYNTIFNIMRVLVGVDILSIETLNMIQEKEKLSLVQAKFDL